MSDEIELLHRWVDEHQDEIVEALRGVLRIPILEEPAAGPDAPFGRPVRDALDYTLEVCRSLGFDVKDVGGYAAHAEFGAGEEMVAALGHLDVVPEGGGWTHPPYGAEIHDGYIYARGASDDKGPTYAALFGAAALKASGLPLQRRVRVVFGCNEESGFGCVHHYWEVAKEERPVAAFTPDSRFPLVYAEKGIANLTLEREIPAEEAALRIVRAAGGLRPNMVPEHAEARLEGTPEALLNAAGLLLKQWDRNLTVEADGTGLTVRAAGKSAHASTPHEGDSAVGRLCRALAELDLPNDVSWLKWIARSTENTGQWIGIAGRDDVAGPLTSNLGIFEVADGKVSALYNIRYPVTWTIDDLLAKHRPVIEEAGWTLVEHSDSPPLYVPLDQEPAATLIRVYQQETGDTRSKPVTMGGGTYARATPNAVCYGAAFPWGADGPAHEPDERISIENLIKATKIYAHALYALAS
jgi:succinyl-diaminopimelate desuccinylase